VVAASAAPSSASAPAQITSAAPAAGTTEFVYHTVQKGEVPGTIAENYGVSLRNLLAWNGLNSRSMIRVGQKLKIAAPIKAEPQVIAATDIPDASTTSTPAVPRTHIVARGESAWIIAQKHGVATTDLLKWNQLSPKSVLREGDTLVLDSPESGERPAV
jgi:membrane-bound lytic murein transglycosylase D